MYVPPHKSYVPPHKSCIAASPLTTASLNSWQNALQLQRSFDVANRLAGNAFVESTSKAAGKSDKALQKAAFEHVGTGSPNHAAVGSFPEKLLSIHRPILARHFAGWARFVEINDGKCCSQLVVGSPSSGPQD